MSGHSHASNVARKKGLVNAKKGALFTRLAQNITLAAKSGDDINFNPSLRMAIEKAKEANMPKDNIERAIKKGTGELGGASIEEVVYEAFGPDGIALLIKCVTDNTNRALTSVKTTLSKNNGNFASAGAVAWMFDERGCIEIEKTNWNDEKELEIIDAGALDVEVGDDRIYVTTEKNTLNTVREVLEKKGFTIKGIELVMIPKNTVNVPDKEKIMAFLDVVEEAEDVNEIFHNANLN